jgi:hypothetical protein
MLEKLMLCSIPKTGVYIYIVKPYAMLNPQNCGVNLVWRRARAETKLENGWKIIIGLIDGRKKDRKEKLPSTSSKEIK